MEKQLANNTTVLQTYYKGSLSNSQVDMFLQYLTLEDLLGCLRRANETGSNLKAEIFEVQLLKTEDNIVFTTEDLVGFWIDNTYREIGQL